MKVPTNIAHGTMPLVKGVDHVTVRVDDAHYDQLVGLLADTLQLPMAWPAAERYPGDAVGFKSGGIVAGQINLEIFRVGPTPRAQAQLYSIAFEVQSSVPECLQELAARAIPHLPPLAVPQDLFGETGTLWTLIFLGDLFSPDLSALSSVAPGSSGRSILPLRFDHAFRNGMAFLCAYNAATYDVAQQRARGQAALSERGGGPLGLVDVHEIMVGVANFALAQQHWQRLFAPLHPAGTGSWRRFLAPLHPTIPTSWQFGQGPAIHLVPDARDGIVGLVCKVRSLDHATAFLKERSMLGEMTRRQVAVSPFSMLGLDIRLVE
jgi:hypothetical protein